MQLHQQGSKPPFSFPSLLIYLVPALLLVVTVRILWTYFQYYIDPDAISYLNITARYIAGDYAHAINAFWSPMGCWGTALLVKATGWELFAAAIAVNTLPALGMVITGQYLFNQFRTPYWERFCFGLMSAFFWAYTVYFQSFTDIWQFFFLTTGVLLLLNKRFLTRPFLWLFLGLMGALAYFGKAYSFYFFPLMIIIVVALKIKGLNKTTFSWKQLLLICGVSILTMLLLTSPWLYLLHEKYGLWTSSTAGKLNLSWWLVGTQELKPGITVVIPPVYKGSLFYFEDPLLVQGRFVHFWDSPAFFFKQVARTGFNSLNWVTSANRISAFYFGTWLITILLLFKRKQTFFDTTEKKILVTLFLIFPLPYWLMTFDGGRYLWFTIPLVAILALLMAERFLLPHLAKQGRIIFVALFFATFLVTPVLDMKLMFRAGENEYKMAQALKKEGIHGSFVSNRSYADAVASLTRISWFTQNPWYCHTLNLYSNAEIITDAQRYGVKYFFYFYEGTGDDYALRNLNGMLLPDLTKGNIPGIKVFQIEK